ncbi:MAG: tRNA lysidine(34) synthetase TilS, partial [Anaerolineales bacterium]|nr:tRNA lysidine(34) synthetase TilS [Anaerolineales bacterium]
MIEHIESILRERCGLIKEAPIVAGISGGPDSLCLLNVLHSAGYRVIVAHFNHMLRPDADADADLVERIAARLNLKWVIGKGDVRQYAGAQKMSIEEAARMMRYQFLMEQARRNDAQAVAVGHTADDQVETVLMNFLRGAGLTGLKGMLYRATIRAFDDEIPIVRPLLDVWREETIVYCAESGLHPRYDPTNASLDFFRNRLRHALIPTLETYNPRFREALWRMSRALTDDYEILSRALDEDWKQTVAQEAKDFIAFNASALEMRPAGLRRNLIRRAIER